MHYELQKKSAVTETKPVKKDDFKSLSMPELLKKLDALKDGLTNTEAKKRLTKYGSNEIEGKKTNMFLKFLTYFRGPTLWMIEATVILSGKFMMPHTVFPCIVIQQIKNGYTCSKI